MSSERERVRDIVTEAFKMGQRTYLEPAVFPMRESHKELVEQMVDKILREEEEEEDCKPNYSYKNAAKELLKEVGDFKVDRYDWDLIKYNEIRSFRIDQLSEIVAKNLENKDLNDDQRSAISGCIDARYVEPHRRYNLYLEYLQRTEHKLINDIYANIHDRSTGSATARFGEIRKLHKIHTDLYIINDDNEDKAWRIVNKAWGIDRGLE